MALHINATDISCGVHSIFGFTYYGGYTDTEACLLDLIAALYIDSRHYSDGTHRLRAGLYLLSDHDGGMGQRIGDMLTTEFPGSEVTVAPGINPNSGNNIKVYTWKVQFEHLMAHRLYEAAVLKAKQINHLTMWGPANPNIAQVWQPAPPTANVW